MLYLFLDVDQYYLLTLEIMFKSDEYSIDNMEKKRGRFVFKKEDLKIELEDGTGYFVNPETDICLYKIPHRPDEEGEEFYMHEIQKHGRRGRF